MSYIIKKHDGSQLAIKQTDDARVKQLANALELIAVELTNGKIVYLSKGAVASIEHAKSGLVGQVQQIEAPDFRGIESPAKEKLRRDLKKLNNKVTV